MNSNSTLRLALSAFFLFFFASTYAQSFSGGVVSTATTCAPRGVPASTIQNVTSPSGGVEPFTYQWEAKIEYSSWTNVVVVGNGLTLEPGILAFGPTSYRRKTTDANGAVSYSNIITFYFSDEFSAGNIYFFGLVPILVNETVPLIGSSAANPGTGDYVYSWEVSTSATGPWNVIAGESGLTYQPPTSAVAGTWYYRKKAIDQGCSMQAYSKVLALTFLDNMPLDPGSYTYRLPCVFPGSTPSRLQARTARGGTPPYQYQWEKKLVTETSWTAISGEVGVNHQPTAITASTQYRRKVVDAAGTIGYTNEDIILYANNTANPGSISTNGTQIAPNAPLAAAINIMSASNFNNGFYHWQQSTDGGANWSDVPSNNGYSSYFPEVAISVTTCFRRAIRENCESSLKDTYTNTICVDPALPLTDGTVTFNANSNGCVTVGTAPGTINGTAPTGGLTPYTYKWETFDGINWNTINGATGLSYTPGVLYQDAKFRRVVRDANGTQLISNEILIGMQTGAPLKGGLIDGPIVTCTNTAPGIINNIIDACGGGGAFTYTWEANTGSGWNTIGGANQPTHNATNIATTTKYRRKVGDGCGNAVYSNEVEVFVYPAIEAGTITPNNQTVCTNQVPGYLGLTQNCHYTNGNVSYQWQRSTSASGPWTNITNATQPVYMPTASNTSSYYRLVVRSSVCNAEAISNVAAVIVNPCVGRNQGVNTGDNSFGSNLSTKGNLKLYPNPVSKGQTIFATLSGDASGAKAIIRGTDGRTYPCTVEGATRGAMQVKVPANVARGTYIIQISTSNKQWIERIVVF